MIVRRAAKIVARPFSISRAAKLKAVEVKAFVLPSLFADLERTALAQVDVLALDYLARIIAFVTRDLLTLCLLTGD